jgi:lysophospholipase L1-like esterase
MATIIDGIMGRTLPWDLVLLGVLGSLLAAGALHHLIAEPIRIRPWRRRGAVIFCGFLAATVAFTAAAPSVWTWSHLGRGDLEVLVLGDSLANDFASAMGTATGDVVRVEDAGIPGCGVSGAVRMRTAHGITQDAPARCNPWADRYRRALADASPDAVVVNVSWDAVSLDLGDGAWTDLRNPATAAAYAEQLRELAEVTRAAGVPVLIANARPFNAIMTPEQVAAFNAVITAMIDEQPHMRLLDLAERVCTSTGCATTTAAGEARYLDDRVHFSAAGKREVAPWLTGAIQGAVRAWDGEGFRE